MQKPWTKESHNYSEAYSLDQDNQQHTTSFIDCVCVKLLKQTAIRNEQQKEDGLWWHSGRGRPTQQLRSCDLTNRYHRGEISSSLDIMNKRSSYLKKSKPKGTAMAATTTTRVRSDGVWGQVQAGLIEASARCSRLAYVRVGFGQVTRPPDSLFNPVQVLTPTHLGVNRTEIERESAGDYQRSIWDLLD
jgi:hypothetical protein